MTCERNSGNKYSFISLILRHLYLLFKQWMLLEKKSGFFPQHDKEFMQLRLRDILGNYAEKKWGLSSHRSTHKFAFARKKHAGYFTNVYTTGLRSPGFYSGITCADAYSCRVPDASPATLRMISWSLETEQNLRS